MVSCVSGVCVCTFEGGKLLYLPIPADVEPRGPSVSVLADVGTGELDLVQHVGVGGGRQVRVSWSLWEGEETEGERASQGNS